MPKNTRQNSGFAIGLVLLVIVLIAAVTTFIVKTTTRFDVTSEMSRIDVMNFRNNAADVFRGVQRIASSCTVVDNGPDQGQRASLAYFNTCVREIRTSLRADPHCETDLADRRCPYNMVYGGSTRGNLPDKMFTAPDVKWDIAYDVRTPSNVTDRIQLVLFMDKLTREACIAIEQTLATRLDVDIITANQLTYDGTDQDLPLPRKEGCIRYDGPNHQYYIVIGSFYE